ncbi:MAG: hypothetical protein K8S97_08460, partial [Anaerolineae bacterium]|nr:hypothetical protein [Anaerolineae bacterium]
MQPTTDFSTQSPPTTAAGEDIRRKILDFIIQFKQDHDGLSPSPAEIGSALHLSVSGVRHHLPKMQAEGTINPFGRRGIMVNGGCWISPNGHQSRAVTTVDTAAQLALARLQTGHEKEVTKLKLAIEKLEEDLENLQAAVDEEVTWWKAKALQFHHLLQQ